jgi:hypothetical protein
MRVIVHPAVNGVHPVDIDGISGIVEARQVGWQILHVYIVRYNSYLGQSQGEDSLAGVSDVLRYHPRLTDISKKSA